MKKNIVIVILILSLCASLYLFVHSRDSPININTSSVQALESLPGIGEVLAVRIIQGRPYKDLYELDRVKGIGPKTIEGLKGEVVTN